MKKIKLLVLQIAIISSLTTVAQVGINTDGTTPDASAILDLKSIEKGFLTPRMTQAQIEVISNPVNGLIVYNTDDDHLYIYNSTDNEWKEIAIGTGTITPTTPNWTCGDTLIDSRDGKSYATVLIGTQCWMAENLNIGTMINSTNGGTNGDGEQSNNSIYEKYCYDNNTSNCDTYGGLYQWDEMMQYVTTEGTQGICPTGWHVPTDAEWCTLENEVDAGTIDCGTTGWRGTDSGGNLKETGTTHWNSPNTGATNSSGFTALACGYTIADGSFTHLTQAINFWTSNEVTDDAFSRTLLYNTAQVLYRQDTKEWGESVRCIKD